MSIFNLNVDLVVREFLPPDKREDVEISWLNALLAPLQTLHDDTFLVYKPDVKARAKHNGQKVVLESILNDTFGVVGPQFILIDNTGDNVVADILYNESEGLPDFILHNESEAEPAVYFNNESELTNNREFVVKVPLAVYTAEGEAAIKFEIDRLRPYSTFYTITTY
jgi:hypothetical protein